MPTFGACNSAYQTAIKLTGIKLNYLETQKSKLYEPAKILFPILVLLRSPMTASPLTALFLKLVQVAQRVLPSSACEARSSYPISKSGGYI